MTKVVFLDRDGVIIEDTHHLHKKEEVKLIQNSAKAIKLLNEHNYLVIVVSNQSVVARGLCTEEEVKEINNYMNSLILEEGGKIDSFYFCPHHPIKGENPVYTKECDCRKPNIGMILRAQKDFHIKDTTECFLIGDKTGDIQTGQRAGCKTILVKTGYSGMWEDLYEKSTPDYLADDLYNSVKKIILKDIFAN